MKEIYRHTGILSLLVLLWMTAGGNNSKDSLYTDPLTRYLPFKFKTERQWDTIRNTEGISGYHYPGSAGRVNYAFHPFWMGTSYNRYELQNIKRLGYFAYFIFSDNKDWLKAYSWTTTSLLKTAEEEDCKIDMVVFCSGKDNIDLVLNDNLFQAIEVEDFISCAQSNIAHNSGVERVAAGVNIYFSGLTEVQMPKFKFFLQYCRQMLHQQDMELVLSVAISDSLLFDGSILAVPDIITTADFDYFGNVGNGMYITTNHDTLGGGKTHPGGADKKGLTKEQLEKLADTVTFLKKLSGAIMQVPGMIRQLWFGLQDDPVDPVCPTDTLFDRASLPGMVFIVFALFVLVLNILSVVSLVLFLLRYLDSTVHDFVARHILFFGIASSIIVWLNLLLLVLSFGNWWQAILLLITVGMILLGIMPFIHMRKKPLP
jgi:hypothetical protein